MKRNRSRKLNVESLESRQMMAAVLALCFLCVHTASAMEHPKTLNHAQQECKRLYGQIHTKKGVWTTAGYTPPDTYREAMKEIKRMRAYLVSFYTLAWKDSLQHPDSADFGLGLILYGSGAPGHEFDHI